MEKLKLTKVVAWAVSSSDDERSSSIKGYYKDYNIASVDSKGSGWFGSDGDVVQAEIYEDEEGNIYTLKSVGKYKDVDRKYREEAMKKIKDKLTPEELKLLGL
tara:strand:- start:50312 stop:50620 length:309 start_codon:yes stop_codon:yes gene_type:complete